MPSTINGLLVFLFALIPGVPGETVYSNVAGLNWRENRLRRVIRIIIISLAGLMCYILVDDLGNRMGLFDLVDPIYVMPSMLAEGVSRETVSSITLAYLGHVVSSTSIGVGLAYVWDYVASRIQNTTYPSAWSDMVDDHAPGHWVVVQLTDGESWAGIIETADTDVPVDERDILLREPAKYSEKKEAYIVSQHQHLYLPAELVKAVAAVHDRKQENETERRINEVGDVILEKVHWMMCNRRKRRKRRTGSKPEPPESLPEITKTPTPYLAGNGQEEDEREEKSEAESDE